MQDDLKERLRAWSPLVASGYEAPAASLVMDDAADHIEALEVENERLRGALGLIIENESADTGYGNSSAKIAHAALGDWKPEAGDLGGDHVR